jgi:ABC-type Na+ efflux pump permease subunit
MFKNFDKVFKFSFKNQAGTKGFKIVTVLFALLLLLGPILSMMIVGYFTDKNKELKSCGAERICVVNLTPGDDSFFETLSDVPEADYANLKYEVFHDEKQALDSARQDNKSIVLYLSANGRLRANMIIPKESTVKKSEAKNYLKFIERYEDLFTLNLSGVSGEAVETLKESSEYLSFTESGLKEGINIKEDEAKNDELKRERVLKVVNMALPYGTMMLLYMMIISYGQNLSQSVVMEKESKLMDTMLVSVRPDSLIFGKLLGAIATVLLQVLVWLFSLMGGFALGAFLSKKFFPGSGLSINVFFEGMKDINVFRPYNVVLAILFLVLGFVVYLCLASLAGSMSTTKEDASSKNVLFVTPLLISFFALMGAGGMNATTTKTWMLLVPFTGAMVMPANVSLGNVSWVVIACGLVIYVLSIMVLVYMAGKIYKMMSLYKGNKLSIGDVLKRTFSKS